MVHLQSLNLANNKFNGSVPLAWGQLSNLKNIDLSSNDLTGRIPMQLFSVAKFNFTETRLICGSNLEHPCVSSYPLPVSTSRSKLRVVITSASCGAFVLLSLGAIFAYRYHQLHKLKHDMFVDVPGEDDSKVSLGQLEDFLGVNCNLQLIILVKAT
ncbi:hypothetical protein Dsin_016077 [Dipteronia sinensis]|uniref:Uncharacterized protein n=1 Tax=Dipteronia sinensis TaxID=43782 RepID=A0AAE0E562_9ROSI|nr:hypothetical protein Dsin_016077 [Dipteronia sinensis]